MAPGGAKIIFVNPRKSPTAAYAERTGSRHLQVWPGTDSVLDNAIARYFVEQGWEDADFIARKTVSQEEIDQEEKSWRRRRFGMTFEDYKAFLLADDAYAIENAAATMHIPAEKIVRAARSAAAYEGAGRPAAYGSPGRTREASLLRSASLRRWQYLMRRLSRSEIRLRRWRRAVQRGLRHGADL